MSTKLKHIARPMQARNREDSHRAATQLELLFDLVFVIAIALAAAGLHHSIAEHHYLDGIVKFLLAFFALWWPWNHFTWFASAFDNDDPTYRSSVMVMMFGALLIGGGIPVFFESLDARLMAIGYVVLRLAYLFLWWRVGQANAQYSTTAKRYILGQLIVQCCWVAIAFLTPIGSASFVILFCTGIIAELLVPVYANRANPMPWHKEHTVERFGLLNIIVLGEVLLAAALAIQAAAKGMDGHFSIELMMIAVCATVITFSLWWFYFCEEENQLWSDDFKHVFLWGYGHFFIYASAAAVGAGFAAMVDASKHHAHGDPQAALWTISISIGIYLFGLWFIRDRHLLKGQRANALLIFAALIVATPLLPVGALLVITLLTVTGLVFRLGTNTGSN